MSKGTYSLLVHLPEGREMRFGSRKGRFPAGYYVYVGSAMGGLDQRVRRHLRISYKGGNSPVKGGNVCPPLRWHIDFLLEHGRVIDVERIHSGRRLECELSRRVGESGGYPVKGFGCSDCRCETHLYYFREVPRDGIKVKVG
jgi:Uri superfamily endonuclease